MSAEAATLTRSWRVGRHTATLTLGPLVAGQAPKCVIEWSGAVPRSLTTTELEQYRAGRNAAIAELSAELGLSVALVEV